MREGHEHAWVVPCLAAMLFAGSMTLVREPSGWAKEPEAGGTDVRDEKPAGMSDEEWEKLKAKRPLPFDNGPSTIDVSTYPPEMRDIYENLFSKRCSKCHTIARPINAPYALPEEWNKYIKKMMRKPGSGIPPDVAKKIAQFLIYDSQVRKASLVADRKKAQAAK